MGLPSRHSLQEAELYVKCVGLFPTAKRRLEMIVYG